MNDADGHTGAYSANSGIVVEGGKWDGNGRAFPYACTLLAFGHCSELIVRDTKLADIPLWHGIEINAVERATVERVQFEGCTNEALQLDTMNSDSPGVFPWWGPYDDTRCRDITIKDCKFENVLTAVGSHSAPAAVNVTIRGCVVNGSKGPAIRPNGYANLVVEDCRFNGCDLAFQGPASGLAFRNNTVFSPTTGGVDFASCSAVNVSDNVFVGAPYSIVRAPNDTIEKGNWSEAPRNEPPAFVGTTFVDRLEVKDNGSGPVQCTYAFAGTAGAAVAVSSRDTVTFAAIPSGSLPLQYQWCRDNRPIPGATHAIYSCENSATLGGVFTLVVSNDAGIATSAPVAVIPTVGGALRATPQLRNISVRATIGSGRLLNIGYVTRGTGEKTAIVRGVGPGLRGFGIPDAAANLQISAYNRVPERLWTADRWNAGLSEVFPAVGAFQLERGSSDVAIVTNLPTGGGTFDVAAGTNGVALAEIYDASPNSASSFANLSALTRVSADEPMIAGFAVAGLSPARILIRAVGPGLKGFGVEAPAGSVTVELCDSQGRRIATNAGWNSSLADLMASAGAFPLEAGSLDAALAVDLEPGQNYTAIICSGAGTAGKALVELYLLP